jgi:hypothetical protein
MTKLELLCFRDHTLPNGEPVSGQCSECHISVDREEWGSHLKKYHSESDVDPRTSMRVIDAPKPKPDFWK